MIEGRRARFSDAVFLSNRLRHEDAREISGVWSCGAQEGLFLCLLHSDRAFCLHEGGEPRALCGITDSHYSGLQIGIPWLLAGEHLFNNRRWVSGASRTWIDRLLLDYDVLTNLTDSGNSVHLRWLSWSGFLPLRDIPAYGRFGRRFSEFYRVNPRRPVNPDSARDVLQARPAPTGPASGHSLLPTLARAGVALLDEDVPVTQATLCSLAGVLRDLQRLPDAGSHGPRMRRAALRLLQEAAPRIVGARAAIDPPQPPASYASASYASASDAAALVAWCEIFAEVGVACALETGPEPVDVVVSLVPRRVPRVLLEVAAGGRATSTAVHGMGPGNAFRLMTRHYQRALTLDGRVRPGHGYRLHAAALDIADKDVLEPLGMPRAELERIVTDLYTGRFLLCRADEASWGLGAARRSVRALEVSHGDVVARLGARIRDIDRIGESLAPALRSMLDLQVAGGSRMSCLAEVLAMAGTVAEGVALQCLPGLRLGGLDSGYAQRHGLYRLLRAWILQAAAPEADAIASPLLDEAAALLTANRLDQWLLAAGEQQPGAEQSTAADAAGSLAHCVETVWGPWLAADGDLDDVCEVLAPALLIPVAHAVQLAPALLAWQLAATGGLTENLALLGKVLVDERRDPQAGVRKFLRRRYAQLGMVGLPSGLEHSQRRGEDRTAPTKPSAASWCSGSDDAPVQAAAANPSRTGGRVGRPAGGGTG